MARAQRIATNNETGRRYLVTRIDFSQREPMVYVEDVCAATQEGSKLSIKTTGEILKFKKTEVSIVEHRLTWKLVKAMWREYHEANGEHVVTNRAGNMVLKRNQIIKRQRRAARVQAHQEIDRIFDHFSFGK